MLSIKHLFEMTDLMDSFSLERVGKSGSRFDPEKAKWFNHQWMQRKTDCHLTDLFLPTIRRKGVEVPFETIEKVIGMVKERVTFIHEFWDQSYFFFEAPAEYDEKVVKKRWKESTPKLMTQLATVLESIEDFSSSNTETAVKKWIEENELGMGAIMNAFRLCIVGAAQGPHMFDIIEVIGKEETIARLQDGIKNIQR